MTSTKCNYCANEIPLHMERCPHCALPGIFPNVVAADQAEERQALNKRYQETMQRAVSNGCQNAVQEFEKALSKSKAVIARSLIEADRLASSDKEIYATFYQLVEAQVRLPSGSKWDSLREVADSALFPGYRKHIRFAVLSLNGLGLSNYGECFLVLRENMIAHRSSVFEDNSVLFMQKHNLLMSDAHKLPKGHRAVWEERGKLSVIKLADKLNTNTNCNSFQQILVKEGITSSDDSFVEVHVWGPMTARTLERVIVDQPKRRASRVILKGLCERLKKVKVNVEIKTKAGVA